MEAIKKASAAATSGVQRWFTKPRRASITQEEESVFIRSPPRVDTKTAESWIPSWPGLRNGGTSSGRDHATNGNLPEHDEEAAVGGTAELRHEAPLRGQPGLGNPG
ncbi:hypothetical protein PG994_004024 [Apiospora phragmitis]|uniref:Uncharacterized protein n=1 Tax=Apiospora phragmitis TaxID=2905665 RepID=A0ABR1VZW0_9PEZI